MRVLLIDDDECDNEFHEMEIKEAGLGVQVQSIANSREALKYLQNMCNTAFESLPEFIFLDINMPLASGYELLDEFRKTPDPFDRKRETKVFILSTSINAAVYERAVEQNEGLLVGSYTKPLTKDVFLEILQKYIRGTASGC